MKRDLNGEKKPVTKISGTDDLESPKLIRNERDEYMKKELEEKTLFDEEKEETTKLYKYKMYFKITNNMRIYETYKKITGTGMSILLDNVIEIEVLGVDKEENSVELRMWNIQVDEKYENYKRLEPSKDVEIQLNKVKGIKFNDDLNIIMVLFSKEDYEEIKMTNIRMVRYSGLKKESKKWCNLIYSTENRVFGRNDTVVVKRLNKNSNPNLYDQFTREMLIYKDFQEHGGNKNVCKLIGFQILKDLVYEGSIFPCIVLEEGIDMRKYLLNKSKTQSYLPRIPDYFQQIHSAMLFVHRMRYIYYDLKPENFIIKTENGREIIKLIDFGLSLNCIEAMQGRHQRGTPGYVAPEVISKTAPIYVWKIDTWSLGCVFLDLIGNDLSELKRTTRIHTLLTRKDLSEEDDRNLLSYGMNWILERIVRDGTEEFKKIVDETSFIRYFRLIRGMLEPDARIRSELEKFRIPDGVQFNM